jgi:hypothetical protein
MIRLPLRFFVRRLLWLPPLVLVLIVLALLYATAGPALASYSVSAIVLAPIAMWLTVQVGSADSNAHREMLAARVGSVSTVHTGRALGGVVASIPFVLLCVLMPFLTGMASIRGEGNPPLPSKVMIVLGGLALHLGGALIGVAIGTFVHRPIVTRTSINAIAGIALVAVLPFVPPVTALLRSLNRNEIGLVWPFVLACWVLASLCVTLSSAIAARR